MLLTDDVLTTIVRRNQLDLEAISDIYRGSQSITWLSEQVRFLDRLTASLAEYMAKSERPIGPLHPLRTQMKITASLQSNVTKRLDALKIKNARRAARTTAQRKHNSELADAMRAIIARPVENRAPVAVRADVSVLTNQLGGYDPLASPEERARQLAALPRGGNIDEDTSRRQADELDAIFGIKPEDKQ